MKSERPFLYLLGWPGHLGGADTKLAHLLALLHQDLQITVVPNESRHLQSRVWLEFMDRLPDGRPWTHTDYFTSRTRTVNPAIVHVMRSKEALVRAGRNRGLETK